ncbi:MAG: site-specific integrase, partial [Proteobacteria bacterium]|nr:site-specific integrase [Pseudomonadota bacterium]
MGRTGRLEGAPHFLFAFLLDFVNINIFFSRYGPRWYKVSRPKEKGLVEAFSKYLTVVRGRSENTARAYVRDVNAFFDFL